MTADPRTDDLLRTLLGETSPMLPFAEAVVLHLATAAGGTAVREEIVGEVAEVLQAVQEQEEPLPVPFLCERPALLASLFQNADLLDPAAPETHLLARMVLEALEQLDGRLA